MVPTKRPEVLSVFIHGRSRWTWALLAPLTEALPAPASDRHACGAMPHEYHPQPDARSAHLR